MMLSHSVDCCQFNQEPLFAGWLCLRGDFLVTYPDGMMSPMTCHL